MTALNEARRVAEAAVARAGKPLNGIVSAVDPVNHAVKVLMQPDNVESGWLPVATIAAGSIRICRVPDMNEHVTLLAMEGDAEHLSVIGVQFDAVVMPPLSPATGKPAQPGELLIRTGCGLPPALGNQTDGTADGQASWWHITQDAIYSGVGETTETMTANGVTWRAGDCTASLTSSGFAVTGGNISTDKTVIGETDVKTGEHSLNDHVHTNGNGGGNTGGPVG